MDHPTVIEVDHLAHRYGSKTIYADLNFNIPPGKVYGLLGKNGVGKTTLIKILTAYLGLTLALLEPTYRLKAYHLAVAAGVAGLFLLPATPGGYSPITPILAVPLLLLIPAVLLPAYRFRYRRVS